jgi:pilus assembly protein Flp/PilA
VKEQRIQLHVQWELLKDQSGQDLIEYGFLFALVAFAATASMTSLATDINKILINIGATLTSYTG